MLKQTCSFQLQDFFKYVSPFSGHQALKVHKPLKTRKVRNGILLFSQASQYFSFKGIFYLFDIFYFFRNILAEVLWKLMDVKIDENLLRF